MSNSNAVAQKRSRMTTRTLSVCALLCALNVVFARFMTVMPSAVARFSIEAVPVLLAGYFFGPVPGMLVGFVGAVLCGELALEQFGIEFHMGIIFKFSMICSIVAATLLYERLPWMRHLLRVPVHCFRACCSAFVFVVESIIMPWKRFSKKSHS